MSGLRARLDRLERALGAERCPLCAVRPIEDIELAEGEPEPPDLPCQQCGGYPEHISRVIVLLPAGVKDENARPTDRLAYPGVLHGVAPG